MSKLLLHSDQGSQYTSKAVSYTHLDVYKRQILLFGLVAITFVIMCMSFAMYYVQKKKYMKENIEY